MAYFPSRLSRAESDAEGGADARRRWAADGIGFAVAERRADGAFIGLVGLSRVRIAPMQGAVEVGWRLGREHWGQGYAIEAARGWLAHGFATMRLAEVVAFTATGNLRSQAVMRRLGMRRDPARDFAHPALPEGHPLRPHLVFAIDAAGWSAGAPSSGPLP